MVPLVSKQEADMNTHEGETSALELMTEEMDDVSGGNHIWWWKAVEAGISQGMGEYL
jgi:hypothetical protein